VDGIPDFVFLNKDGVTIAQTLANNPHHGDELRSSDWCATVLMPAGGQVSKFEAPVAPGADDPVFTVVRL